ncbi:pyrroline-5-carboxylate reductase [Altericroceibacterium xinjiangense]|uniref:pyrroline-5-carboxylate reductase n=1 Tax=Altericroceibacterium xinjiangense TaxID=762261 RepID=UPI000F7DA022|nr:pyrroline-5-carboxylate reductase [Altericroceibacterium xinjiangense]
MGDFASILIVGCGNMAGAMLEGWLVGGLAPQRFTVVSPSPRDLPEGVAQFRSLAECLPLQGSFDAVLLGFKPQKLAELAPSIAEWARGDTAVISILAGVELETLARRFPEAGAVVRAMPNLAVALGKSPIALAERGLDDRGRTALVQLMSPLGTPEWVPEDQYELVTALAGSGPAFVYRFIDSLAQGAEQLGLAPDQAGRLAVAMVEGAAALAASSPHDPAELARRVASPGGVTQAGLDVLDDDQALAALITQTLRAARDRSVQMGAEAASSTLGFA